MLHIRMEADVLKIVYIYIYIKKNPFFSPLIFLYVGNCVIKNIELSSARLQLSSL